MDNKLDRVHIGSTMRALRRAKIYGKMDTSVISVYNAISYFLENEDLVKEIKPFTYNGVKRNLSIIQSNMLSQYRNELCNYFVQPIEKEEVITIENTPPTVRDNYIEYEGLHVFKVGEFIRNYYDKGNNLWNKLVIYPIQSFSDDVELGRLLFEGVEVTEPITIDIFLKDLNYELDLIYENDSLIPSLGFFEGLKFKVSNKSIKSLFSEHKYVYMKLLEKVNHPPKVGDGEVSISYEETLVFTKNMFVSDTDPSYSDPEGDAPYKLRIDSLPEFGTIMYNDEPVEVGFIISFEEIIEGKLTYIHELSKLAAYEIDFRFSISDTGSKNFGS